MPSPLPTITGETLSYGDVIFDALYTSSVHGEPVYDDARRMVKMLRWSITVLAKVTVPANDFSTDATLENMRQQLTMPGQLLIYDRKGFGPFIINDPTVGVWDVDWGPKPELMDFKPIGDTLAAFVQWRCVVSIPECEQAVYIRALMMNNWDVSWNINKDGYSVITYTGAIEIPLTFSQGQRKLPDNADNYRDMAAPPTILGFQREQKYTLSKDRKRLDFSIIDTEMPIPLPTGTTLCDVKHSVSSNLSKGFIRWTNVISGTIRVTPNYPRGTSFDRFWNIAISRINVTTQSAKSYGTGRCVVLITDFKAEESISGIDNTFSLTYVGIGYSLKDVLFISGLFRATPFQSYINWKNQNDQTAGRPRGMARSFFPNNADLLVDLCEKPSRRQGVNSTPITFPTFIQKPPQSSNSVGGVVIPKGVSNVTSTGGGESGGGQFGIDPLGGWLRFVNETIVKRNDQTIRHKPLAGNVIAKNPGSVDLGSAITSGDNLGTGNLGIVMNVPDRIQRISSPSSVIILSGNAMRLGNPIEAPELPNKIDGKTCTETSRLIGEAIVGAISGIPIFSLRWEITYILESVTAKIPIIANPGLVTGGGQDAVDLSRTAISR